MTALNFKHHHDIIRGARSGAQENKLILNDEGFSITSVVNSNCKIRIFRRISKKNIKNRFENFGHLWR